MFQSAEENLNTYADQLHGLVVKYTATYFHDKSEKILETFYMPQKKSTMMQSVRPVVRLVMLQVWAVRNCKPGTHFTKHYNDVTMSTMASQITNLTIVYSTVYSGADQRKHQSSVSLAFVRGIHRSTVNSPHKGQ